MHTIAWIGFSQSLFAAILMFTKKNSSLPDKILSGWLTLLAIEFMTCALDYEIFGEPLLSSSFLLFNPAMYLYISSLTRPDFRLKWTQLIHFLPYAIFEIIAYQTQEPFYPDIFFVRDENYTFRISFAFANIISWAIYNPISLVFVHKHRMHLKNEQSNIEQNENLGWVLSIGIFYVVYCIIGVILFALIFFYDYEPLTPHIYNYSVLLILIFALSFYGLRQQVLSPKILASSQKTPYKNSSLTDEVREKIKNTVIQHFEKEKAYLNPALNMDLLASDLKIPKHQLTEVLNTTIGKNFFNFVNAYRVEAVKTMLLDPSNKYSIEAIGYDCGFSSKSSFYTVFKQMTGYTPVEFRTRYLS
jgi:AraC-like DNA-binding protein